MEAIYDHELYSKCFPLSTFTNQLKRKLPDGRKLGPNLLYRMFYHFKILKGKDNKEPYQIYDKLFLVNIHPAPNGTLNKQALLTPEGQKYFPKWIDEKIAQAEEMKSDGKDWRKFLGV